MSTTRHRLALLAAIACGVLLGGAAPAGAATTGGTAGQPSLARGCNERGRDPCSAAGAATTVLANEKYKWFYWAGPLIALGLLGVLAAVGVGYYLRVMRPKWRGRQSS